MLYCNRLPKSYHAQAISHLWAVIQKCLPLKYVSMMLKPFKPLIAVQTPKATSAWDFFLTWMTQHEKIAQAMGKPLVLEELGTAVTANQSLSLLRSQITSHRTQFMQMVYGQFNQSLAKGNIWRGTCFLFGMPCFPLFQE